MLPRGLGGLRPERMHEPDAAVHTHAAVDLADVGAHRAEREAEALRNLLVS